jgi:hypothetical protein
MDEAAITQYLTSTFGGIQSVVAPGATFFFSTADRKMPFATIVTSDAYDRFSNLDRPAVFRLNFGVSKETFRGLFGAGTEENHDFAALDRIMPHPVYGGMFWVCVLSPSPATFEQGKPLLAEAHERSLK